MIVKAVVKLQSCTSKKDRYAFVAKDRPEHGIAKGRIAQYEVVASSWAHVRRVLKNFDVMGFTNVRPETVEDYREDIGSLNAGLRRLP